MWTPEKGRGEGICKFVCVWYKLEVGEHTLDLLICICIDPSQSIPRLPYVLLRGPVQMYSSRGQMWSVPEHLRNTISGR